ncbi:phosphoglycerate mutase-like protein [Roridomyces roridus]|uniref:Phosphoglycerate mutase-like protein n=1 Tax=Roridomyces roridus TaxID=1738132 RepID=A0AAD7BUX6_9AGAR|nr:phosphoglycerate mutase-like protein [Roridomyces roridus]
MIETIYIARHGFRMNWVNSNWKSVTGLPRDPPLAAFGETQAQELADYFLSLPEDQRPTAIFSSPYYRCLQTAHPTAVALSLPLYVEHGLSEWYSPVTPGTGLHPRPSSAASLEQYFSSIDSSWSSIYYPPRKGEDVEEVLKRARDFLDLFVPAVPEKHKRVLLVSHAATTIALARALLKNPEMPLRVGCCSLTEVVRSSESSGWEAKRLADGAHLKEGAAREWGFEHIEIANGQVVPDPGVPGTEDEVDDLVGAQVALASNL